MSKKITGLFLILVLTMGISALAYATEEQSAEYIPLSQNYVDMLQVALDNAIPIANMDRSASQLDFNCRDSVYLFVSDLISSADNAIGYLVSSIDFSSMQNSRISAHNVLRHELFDIINYTIHACDDFIYVDSNISFSIERLKEFVGYVCTLSDYYSDAYSLLDSFITIEPRTSPYNRIAFGRRSVFDQWTGTHTVSLTTSVWYFRRNDSAIFLQAGSHRFHPPVIHDNRMVSFVNYMHHAFLSNGTSSANVGTNVMVGMIHPTTGFVSNIIHLVSITSFSW